MKRLFQMRVSRPSMRGCILLALIFGAVGSAEAAVEFCGFVTSNGKPFIMLVDRDFKRRSEWLRIGDTFRGTKFLGFDGTSQSLVLEHSGKRVVVWLNGEPIGCALQRPNKAPEPTPGPVTPRAPSSTSK